jgi:hypothetical protein
MDLSSVTAVGTRMMRSLSTVEQAAAAALITELSGLVRLRVPDADIRAVTDPSWAAVVSGRIAAAVARIIRNPDGLVEETVGGETSRWAASTATSSEGLSLDDWAVIVPAVTDLGPAHVVSLWG